MTRIDGVVAGTYVGSGSAVPEEFLRQAAKVLALVRRAERSGGFGGGRLSVRRALACHTLIHDSPAMTD